MSYLNCNKFFEALKTKIENLKSQNNLLYTSNILESPTGLLDSLSPFLHINFWKTNVCSPSYQPSDQSSQCYIFHKVAFNKTHSQRKQKKRKTNTRRL